ncbi:MAG: hypothetical protein COB15_01220 [Flavobacteriales bacterium]|nr:MAG: hypothetical protein COB15_01220 [Flavobacteriales bacterium]
MNFTENNQKLFYKGGSEIILVEEDGNKRLIKSVDESLEDKKSGLFQEFTIQENKDLNFTRKIFKKGYYNGKPSIWMDYIEGNSLYELYKLDKKITIPNFIDLAIKLLTAIHELHQNNIIHKDISSKNILIDQNNELKLIDLELAVRHEYKVRNFSNPNHLEGTLEYIAPELTGRINQAVDVRSDLYSIGVVLYKLLVSKYPFEHKNASEFIYSHIAIKPVSPNKIDPTIPLTISVLILKLLEKKSEDRYQTALGLLRDLEKIKDALASNTLSEIKLREQDYDHNLRIPEKLFGREKEMTALQLFLQSSCKVTFISGESGTGKTSLVHSIHPYISENKGYFFSGKFDQLNRNKPYSALSDVFKGFLESIFTESTESISQWKKELINKLGNSAYILEPIIPGITEFLETKKELEDVSYVDEQNRINFVFSNFISCLAERQKLMVIFIDDFQWADLSSLQILEYAFKTVEGNHSMYVIGSYRSEEVDENHIFYNFRKRLNNLTIPPSDIVLENLKEEDILNILWGTFKNERAQNKELASIIYNKTNGNAFFTNQFIKTIYSKDLVQLDVFSGHWNFDINEIKKSEFSSNVIDLLLSQFTNLDENMQKVLSYSACLPSQFNLNELKETLNLPINVLSETVEKCVNKNFIEPLHSNFLERISSEDPELFFSFTHDKIKEVSYALLDKENKRAIHLKFAQNNINQDLDNGKGAYTVANHLNKAIEYNSNINQELSTLVFNANLKAGLKAKKSAAFEIAEGYFKCAQNQLKNCKTPDSDTIYQLEINYAESLHLIGKNIEAEKKYLSIEKDISDKFKSIEVAEKLIHFYTNNGRFKDAYQIGVNVLQKFNFKIPKSPLKPRLICKVIKTKLKLKKNKFADILNLPTATDPDAIAIASIIGAILKSAYQISPELCVEVSTDLINLCLKKGNTKDSPVGYFVFGGIFLGGVLGNHQLGYKFGDLSIKMVDKFNSVHQRSEVQFVHGYFANTWKNGIISTNKLFDDAYDSGSEIGDFFHMSCSRTAKIQSNFMFGVPLDTILKENTPFLKFVSQSNNLEAEYAFKSVIQSIKALQGKTDSIGSFNDAQFNEDEFLKAEPNLKARHFLHYYHINKMIVNYHLKQYDAAHDAMKLSEKYLSDSVGMQHVVWHYLYKGLIASALNQKTASNKYILELKKSNKYLTKVKKFNTDVYGNLSDLIALELNKTKVNSSTLYDDYESFIYKLKSEQAIQLLAIAYENYANVLNSNNQTEKAQLQISKAKSIYRSWNATLLYENIPSENVVSSTGEQSMASVKIKDLDLNSILKASTAIAEETNQSKLFEKMMEIVVENMGATKAILVINSDTGHTIQAEFSNGKIDTMRGIQLDDVSENENYPSSIINYVIRTKTDVIIESVAKNGLFSSDSYFLKNKIQSVVCHPLINRQKLMGVMYIENNLSENLFNEKRVEILHLLSAQMTISLKNLLLYENLENAVTERTKQVVSQTKIIEHKTKEIYDSINYARNIQFATMPDKKELSNLFEDSFILYKPKDIVSGDFYYFTELTTGEKIIIAADCTGHGVPGALMSVIGSFALNSIINSQQVSDPSEILSQLQIHISRAFNHSKIPINDGMDLTICLVDSKNTIHCSGAMNGAVVIDNSGELTYLAPDRIAIGDARAKNHQFTTKSISPGKGSMLYMMTDGYQDQFGGEKGKKFRKKQLYQIFQDIRKLSAEDQYLTLNTKFNAWQGNEEQVDDVLVIGIKM